MIERVLVDWNWRWKILIWWILNMKRRNFHSHLCTYRVFIYTQIDALYTSNRTRFWHITKEPRNKIELEVSRHMLDRGGECARWNVNNLHFFFHQKSCNVWLLNTNYCSPVDRFRETEQRRWIWNFFISHVWFVLHNLISRYHIRLEMFSVVFFFYVLLFVTGKL